MPETRIAGLRLFCGSRCNVRSTLMGVLHSYRPMLQSRMNKIRNYYSYLVCFWVALLVPCALSGQSAAASSAQATEQEFQAALDAQDHGDLGKAESILASLRKRNPGNFAIDESLGMLLASAARYDEALPILKAATKDAPNSDVAHTNLGAVYYHLERAQDAAAEFKVAVRINPKNLAALKSLGQVLLELHQPDGAAEAYAAALALVPGDTDVQEACAQADVAAGKLDDARRVLDAIPGIEKSATAQSIFGDLEEKSGNFMAAANHYGLAAQLDPSEANIWAVGAEFLRHWTFSGAVQEFEAGAARFPTSTRMKLGLGAAYFGDAKYPQAIIVFADLLKESPDNALYAEFLGMSCNTALQQKQPRCLELVTYAKSHPHDARVSTYAAASLRLQDPEQANLGLVHDLLNAAIAANPKLAEAQYQMAVLKQDENSWPDSIPYLERAIALKPDYAQAHYHLALAYWRSGCKQEAQQQMDLQKKYSQQEQQDLDQRLRQIVTFRMGPNN
ncbi:MAG TPA: tetratricopeptide repeat protein [Terracidiphilus sp.]|nr:tetratricopeptide repeat protein [Terracidiphilus sp.]